MSGFGISEDGNIASEGDMVLQFDPYLGCERRSRTEQDGVCRFPVRFEAFKGAYSDWSGPVRLCAVHAWEFVSHDYLFEVEMEEVRAAKGGTWRYDYVNERKAETEERRWKFWPVIAKAWAQ